MADGSHGDDDLDSYYKGGKELYKSEGDHYENDEEEVDNYKYENCNENGDADGVVAVVVVIRDGRQ